MQRAQLRVGTLVAERWRVEGVLGVGGMATVYQAVHHRNHCKVALKILHPELNEYEEFRERFLFEAYAGNQVGHSGVINALDDGVLADGLPYLVLEYLEGESLQQITNRSHNPLSSDVVSDLAERLLDILEAAHARGVIHRDIKPENLFLTTSNELKLLDFGIAKAPDEIRSQKTQVGTTMGTPSFMSPEQARGRWAEVDAASDLFAVAATMYVLVSGGPPHQAETTNEALLAAMTRQAPPVSLVAPTVHPGLAAVIDRGLSFEKHARFASAAQMREAIILARSQTPQDITTQPTLASVIPLVRPKKRSDLDITHPPVVRGDTLMALSPRAGSARRRMFFLAAVVTSATVGFLSVRYTSWEDAGALDELGIKEAPVSGVLDAMEPWHARLEPTESESVVEPARHLVIASSTLLSETPSRHRTDAPAQPVVATENNVQTQVDDTERPSFNVHSRTRPQVLVRPEQGVDLRQGSQRAAGGEELGAVPHPGEHQTPEEDPLARRR